MYDAPGQSFCGVGQKAGVVKVTRKASLVAAAAALPASIEGLKEGMLSPGYVASVTGDSVFVRFLGSLTGRAGGQHPDIASHRTALHRTAARLSSLGGTCGAIG
jgi:hypothetical protein